MIFANTFPHCSYSCMHSHCDSKYGNKSGVKTEEEIYPLQKLCVYIYAYEKKTGLVFFFHPPKNPHSWERRCGPELHGARSLLCPAHPPCCRTCFEPGVHIKKSRGMKSAFEVLWQKTKGWITLPGPELLLGPEHSELSWGCRRSLHQAF